MLVKYSEGAKSSGQTVASGFSADDYTRYCGGMRADRGTLSAVAVLADDLRRRMYEFIRRADGPVSRDEAAAAVGISRKLAAFHLDKLVDAGLLEAGFARPAGLRRAGRASKVYAPADVDVQVSIPPRDHAVLADILVGASPRPRTPGGPRCGDGRARARSSFGRTGSAATVGSAPSEPSPWPARRWNDTASSPRGPNPPGSSCATARSSRSRRRRPTWSARSTRRSWPGSCAGLAHQPPPPR